MVGSSYEVLRSLQILANVACFDWLMLLTCDGSHALAAVGAHTTTDGGKHVVAETPLKDGPPDVLDASTVSVVLFEGSPTNTPGTRRGSAAAGAA